jgi:hypothetical protein
MLPVGWSCSRLIVCCRSSWLFQNLTSQSRKGTVHITVNSGAFVYSSTRKRKKKAMMMMMSWAVARAIGEASAHWWAAAAHSMAATGDLGFWDWVGILVGF